MLVRIIGIEITTVSSSNRELLTEKYIYNNSLTGCFNHFIICTLKKLHIQIKHLSFYAKPSTLAVSSKYNIQSRFRIDNEAITI